MQREINLPSSIQRAARLDAALAEDLAEDFTRLARVGTAMAWAQASLPAMLGALGVGGLLEVVVAQARELTRAPRAWAMAWSGDLGAGRATIEALAGEGVEALEVPAFSHTIVGRVAREGRPAWSDDAAQDARFQAAESVQAFSLRSIGCVPIGDHAVLLLEDPAQPGAFGLEDRLRIAALAALAGRVLAGRQRPESVEAAPASPIAGLVGSSPPMVELYASIRAFAPMPWPVLILGETGTGKEAVARALHAGSPRARDPFVPVNCGAIVETLAESTLFGHERGAFTGADRQRDGLLHRVGEGTLFLDEVGELSPALQVKLLRLLQEGTYERVGGDRSLRFSGRVVAATHRLLDQPERRGSFREDLYFRLAACVLRVPPLRDRRSDVPELAHHLLQRASADLTGCPRLSLDPDATPRLKAHEWPGNVRELENRLRGGVARALSRGETTVRGEDLGLQGTELSLSASSLSSTTPDTSIPASLDLASATERFQQQRIHAALKANGGNRSAAARQLGVSRQWLHRLLARWDLEPAG